MKALVIHPGHAFSTVDVFTGLCAGLRANGVEVVVYRLDAQIKLAGALLEGAEGLPPEVDEWYLAGAELLGAVVRHEPDLVIAVNGGQVHPARIALVAMLGRQRTRPLTTMLLCTESPYDRREVGIARFYDVVFTTERGAVGQFVHNRRVYYLPHAYNAEVHRPDGARAAPSDVLFVGTAYPERAALLAGVPGVRLLGFGWEHGIGVPDTTGITDNAEVAAYYRSAAITLNLHRRITTMQDGTEIAPGTAQSLGPRAYEIPACGAFMLCDDDRPELRDVFGDTVPTFRAWDADDLTRQARFWLARPDERRRRARAQAEAVRPHHWGNRARDLLSYVT